MFIFSTTADSAVIPSQQYLLFNIINYSAFSIIFTTTSHKIVTQAAYSRWPANKAAIGNLMIFDLFIAQTRPYQISFSF